jgi:hypothetical protein
VGRDGGGYKVIWVFGKSEYFFERGWTRGPINCPSDLPAGQQIAGWVERFAKPNVLSLPDLIRQSIFFEE